MFLLCNHCRHQEVGSVACDAPAIFAIDHLKYRIKFGESIYVCLNLTCVDGANICYIKRNGKVGVSLLSPTYRLLICKYILCFNDCLVWLISGPTKFGWKLKFSISQRELSSGYPANSKQWPPQTQYIWFVLSFIYVHII